MTDLTAPPPVCELMEKPQAFIPVQEQDVLREWRKAHNPSDYHRADVKSESSFFGPGVTRVTTDHWCNECETSMGIPHALNCSVRAKEIALARHAEWHRKQGIPCSGHPDDPYCQEADRPIAPVQPPPAPDLCSRREGTAASHCDHQTSPAVHPMIPHDKLFRCCHCGRVRAEHYEPPTAQVSEYRQPDHGPFAPKTWVIN